jgi:ribosomal protein L16/L10AE
VSLGARVNIGTPILELSFMKKNLSIAIAGLKTAASKLAPPMKIEKIILS